MLKEDWCTYMAGPERPHITELVQATNGDALMFFKHLRYGMSAEDPQIEKIKDAIRALQNPLAVPPFLWYQAALEFPALREDLNNAMKAAGALLPPLKGKYTFIIDVSAEAQKPIHEKNIVRKMDVASSVAGMALVNSTDVVIYTVSGFAQPMGTHAQGLGFVDLVSCQQPAGVSNMTQAKQILAASFPDRMGLCFDGRDADFLPAEEIYFPSETRKFSR